MLGGLNIWGSLLLSYFIVIKPYCEHFHDTILKRDCSSEVVHLWRSKDRLPAQVSAPFPVLSPQGASRLENHLAGAQQWTPPT